MTLQIDDTCEKLAAAAMACLQNTPRDRILVALAGIPGSGKSTYAQKVCDMINTKSLPGVKCAVVGMDGFHLSRETLRAMPDAEMAFIRRGAPFTFDATGAVEFVRTLSQSCRMPVRAAVSCPSFDHRLKDPVADGTTVAADVSIVIIEGLYVLLQDEPWNAIAQLVDRRWFIRTDIDVARSRVAKRHIESGIESDLDAAYLRVDRNDTLNAIYVQQHLVADIDCTIDQ